MADFELVPLAEESRLVPKYWESSWWQRTVLRTPSEYTIGELACGSLLMSALTNDEVAAALMALKVRQDAAISFEGQDRIDAATELGTQHTLVTPARLTRDHRFPADAVPPFEITAQPELTSFAGNLAAVATSLDETLDKWERITNPLRAEADKAGLEISLPWDIDWHRQIASVARSMADQASQVATAGLLAIHDLRAVKAHALFVRL